LSLLIKGEEIMDEFEKARREEREARQHNHEHDVEKCIAFIEGALNVSISQCHNPATDEWCLAFPSDTSENGWFEDDIDFGDAASCINFLRGVCLLIQVARLQQKERHSEEY
jgi:hypothetical protein